MKSLLFLWRNEAGQDLTEYALLLVLIALVIVASLQGLAKQINTVYSETASDLKITT